MKRYYLKVPKDKVDYALRYGASQEADSGRYFVDGDIPEALEAFTTERPERLLLRKAVKNPRCPNCHSPMTERRGRGQHPWFWGCTRFPHCRGTRQLDDSIGCHPNSFHLKSFIRFIQTKRRPLTSDEQ